MSSWLWSIEFYDSMLRITPRESSVSLLHSGQIRKWKQPTSFQDLNNESMVLFDVVASKRHFIIEKLSAYLWQKYKKNMLKLIFRTFLNFKFKRKTTDSFVSLCVCTEFFISTFSWLCQCSVMHVANMVNVFRIPCQLCSTHLLVVRHVESKEKWTKIRIATIHSFS